MDYAAASKTRSVWHDFSEKQFKLYLNDTEFVILGPHDTITWNTRKNTYVKIVDVFGTQKDEGPRGFTYLPWVDGKWASPVITLRGDARFVLCYPSGLRHYGLHINLHTIQKDDVPELTTNIADVVCKSTEPLVYLRHQISTLLNLPPSLESTYHVVTEESSYDLHLYKFNGIYLIHVQHLSGSKEKMEDHLKKIEQIGECFRGVTIDL